MFFGLTGRMPSGKYCFRAPQWGGFKTQRAMYTFMYHIGNPLLNFFIGYERM